MIKLAPNFILLCSLLWACSPSSKDKNSGYNYVPPPPPQQQQPATAPPPQNDFLSGNNTSQKSSAPFAGQPQQAANNPVAGTQPATAAKPGAITTAAPPVQLQPAAMPVAKGMNPPHGQPGHRCDIAVGAPLNSKPAAQPAAPATATTPVAAPAPPPVTVQKAAPVATAPGMNPPHGQPGHRCDISVGAPLNSAPAKKDS